MNGRVWRAGDAAKGLFMGSRKQIFFSYFRFSVLLWALIVASPELSQAENPPACYKFVFSENPEASTGIVTRSEVWCYQRLSNPLGGLFIFNADGPEVKSELALLVEPDGVLTHSSLLNGEVSTHRVQTRQFNPFSVPLEEPQGITMMQVLPGDEAFFQSADEVLGLFLSQSIQIQVEDMTVKEGLWQASARTLPWRGYWWPHRNQPLSGSSSSPLAKYDRYVSARTGSSPRAVAWENANHRYTGVGWAGHCNGWAASSVLRKEPTIARRDATSGETFSVSDQKGLLAEIDYCSHVAFFGKRYRGRASDNIRDISPAVFHQTLKYYIGDLGKPVAMDYRRTTPVDNHIISGVSMDVKKTSTNTYSVKTTLTVHRYDKSRTNTPGVAPRYIRTYSYTLRENPNGNIVSGSWLSDNPDFLWVPLSPSDCSSNNPRLDGKRVEAILKM